MTRPDSIGFMELSGEQGSDEWLANRRCRITSTRACAVVTPKGKIKTGAARDTLVFDLAVEMAGIVLPSGYVSDDMAYGSDTEGDAVAHFCDLTGSAVSSHGLITHALNDSIATSVDCIADGETVIEIKCPKLATHLRYVYNDVLPDAYYAQCQHHMFVTDIDNLVFMSYHVDSQPFFKRIVADFELHDLMLAEYESIIADAAEASIKLKGF